MLNESTHLSCLADALIGGGIAISATDTVLGLSCLPKNKAAVSRMARIKQRPESKTGFILLASSVSSLGDYIDVDVLKETIETQQSEATPTTYIVPSTQSYPWLGDAELGTQAVRITQNHWIKTLCDRLGPLVSTSANLSGLDPAPSIPQARLQFGPQIDYYCDLADVSSSQRPSRIFNTQTNTFIRR